jgi:NADPH-dependent ferric siderophore reductase
VSTSFGEARVVETTLVAPRQRRIVLRASSLAGRAFAPGADVVLRLPHVAGDRRYSVRRCVEAEGTLEIWVVLHGAGEGSRWAERASPGDVLALAPSPALPIALAPAADTHVFLGDETSLASSVAMACAAGAGARTECAFEVRSATDRCAAAELPRTAGVRWIPREQVAARPGATLLSWLPGADLPLDGDVCVYVTGETWLCTMVQSWLVRTRGVPAQRVRAMPYWKRRTVVP